MLHTRFSSFLESLSHPTEKTYKKILLFKITSQCSSQSQNEVANMMLWTLTLLILVFQNYKSVAGFNGETLVVGDSWGAFSENFLASVCSLSANDYTNVVRTVTNDAMSGSTAMEWSEGETAKNSFENGKDYDFVWLSVGGNDFLGTQCLTEFPDGISSFIGGLLGESTIANYVLDVIADIVESTSNPDLMILFTGYGYPTEEVCPDGDTIDQFNSLNTKIRNTINSSAYKDRVMTIDITDLFVTSVSSPFSDTTWYADEIHINEAGYVKLFSLPEIQSFFQCTTAASESPTSIPTFHPTIAPTLSTHPSESPSASVQPSPYPSVSPSMIPTISVKPSSFPSTQPSYGPTVSHMPSVSARPSSNPSISSMPSDVPSITDTCGASSESFLVDTCKYIYI